jgi:hypothetical protein
MASFCWFEMAVEPYLGDDEGRGTCGFKRLWSADAKENRKRIDCLTAELRLHRSPDT